MVGLVAGARRLLLPKWTAISAYLRSLSLAADASRKKVAPEMPSFDFTPQPHDVPKADEILAKRKKVLNPALFVYYKKHVSCGVRLESVMRVNFVFPLLAWWMGCRKLGFAMCLDYGSVSSWMGS